MSKNFKKLVLLCLFFPVFLVGTSCHLRQVPPAQESMIPPLTNIAVVGFRPALSSGQGPGMARSPITGAVFRAEPVSEAVAEGLSNLLFEKLIKADHHPTVSPKEAAGVFSRLASSHPTWTDREIYLRVGKDTSTAGVMGGHVYRWRERQGTDYAATEPASVAFDLVLMSAADGVILWKARFDKTQISLSENLLDLQTFLKAKGRWMTADELAEIGVNGFVEILSKRVKGEE